MAAPPIPPTRQLFVRFPIRLPREPREVEDIFSKYGQLKHLHLVPKREVAFVTYWKTQDAIEAKKYLDGETINRIECRVEFNRPTRLLVLDNYPPDKSREEIAALLRGELSRFGAIQWIDPMHDKRVAYVMMSSENDAARIAQELQGQVPIPDWKWEIEFHKETSHKPSFFALNPGSSEVSSSPPAAAAAAAAAPPPSNSRDQVPPQASKEQSAAAAAAARSPSPARRSPSPPPPRKRAASPARRSPSLEPAKKDSSKKKQKKRGRSRSRSPSVSSSSLSPPSPPAHHHHHHRRRRRSKHSRSPSPESPSEEGSSNSSSSSSVASTTGNFPYDCNRCKDYLHHLHRDHRKISEDRATKKLVMAWFNGSFEFLRSASSSSRKSAISIRRQPFLKEYLNPFLESVGLQPWSSRTPLYTDWFLRKVLRLPASERNGSQAWRFHRFTSNDAFKEQLQKLLDSLK